MDKKKLKETLVGTAIIGLIVALVATWHHDDQSSPVIPTATETQPQAQPAATVKSSTSLGLTSVQFADRFNAAAKDLRLRYRLHPVMKYDDQVNRDRFVSALNHSLYVSGVMAEDSQHLGMVTLVASQVTNDADAME